MIARGPWRAVFWLLVAGVTVLMLHPRPPPAIDTGWDKANHVAAFAAPMFAALAARLAQPWTLGWRLFAWGAALELIQTQVPHRSGSFGDLAADAVGLLAGWLVFAAVTRYAASRSS